MSDNNFPAHARYEKSDNGAARHHETAGEPGRDALTVAPPCAPILDWETQLEADLLADLFRGDLQMAERMRAIGNFALALHHLQSAGEKLKQIQALSATHNL